MIDLDTIDQMFWEIVNSDKWDFEGTGECDRVSSTILA